MDLIGDIFMGKIIRTIVKSVVVKENISIGSGMRSYKYFRKIYPYSCNDCNDFF